MPSWTRDALRWLAFVAVAWVVLRPALTITISGDDFINPFFVFDDYGPSPFGMTRSVSRDLTRAGHFNYVGQNVGAVVFVGWAYLIGWGVRYSLIYATTKFVVFLLVVLVSARLLRTLSTTLGRERSVWWSRVAVAALLLPALQIHVAWSSDPVASFPLSGYLSTAIGLLALDLAVRAVQRDDVRSAVTASAAFAVAILYYEINVVMVAALVPMVAMLVARSRRVAAAGGKPDGRRLVRRAAAIAAGPAAMTLILQRIASVANRGYTGTDVAVGAGSGRVLLRATAGSVPGAAWRAARRWLGRGFDPSVVDVLTFGVVATALVLVALAARQSASTPHEGPRPVVRPVEVALVACVPLVVWLGATVVQATTAKVRAETVGVGYVYNYYAFGSIGIVLAALLVAPAVAERLPGRVRRAWPVLFVACLVFVAVQIVVNGDVQREFDARLAVNDRVLAAFADQRPEVERCAALAAWSELPIWLDYYRADFADGLDATYRHMHGEAFCPSVAGG